MRDRIAHALTYLLRLVLPGKGRHSAPDAGTPVPSASEPAPNPWARPWPTATPKHVIDRHAPLRGEDLSCARPYVGIDTPMKLRQICERRKAVAYCEIGSADYPYSYDGALITASAFAAAGVSA